MKLFIFIIVTIIVFYIIFCILVYFFQEKFIFYPEKLDRNFSFHFPFNFEERFYNTDDAVINALHFKVPDSKGIVFYFHGNAQSLRTWGGIYSRFEYLGYDMLIFDYRGYGKSTGRMSEKKLFADALYIYDLLASEYGENRIILFGRSVGSGIAVYTASKRKPGAVVLEAPFYSMGDLAHHYFPWVPSFVLRYKFRSDLYIDQVTCPVYVFHGTDDSVIYYESSVKLSRQLKESDEFIPVEGGEHNNLADFTEYKNNLERILKNGL